MPVSEDFLLDLKYRSDVGDVVAGYVNLKKRGSNLVGLCPFHNEKTPSFTVYTATQNFYCFGCSAGGDVITFIRRAENLSYMEAVRFLAERAGLPVPEDGVDDSLSRLKGRIFEANREAARFFHENLMRNPESPAMKYVQKRGLDPGTIRHFGLGYSIDSWDSLLKRLSAKGFSEQEIIAADLAVRGRNNSAYDRFRGRLMFPIIDLRGNVIGFGGRVLDDSQPKYLNTSDTPVFKKSRNLYALNFAKGSKSKRVILAEGYMDVIALHKSGFAEAVATLGTALTGEQAGILARYGEEIVICYDADGAGQKATARAIEIIKQTGKQIRVIKIPGAKDPDEYIKTHGPERFKALIEGASGDVDFKIAELRSQFDTEASEERVAYLNKLAELIAALDNPIERDVYAGKQAIELSVSKDALLEMVDKKRKYRQKARKNRELKEITKNMRTGDKLNPQKRQHLRAAAAEEALINLLRLNPGFLPLIDRHMSAKDFVTDFNARLFGMISDRIRQNKSVDLTPLGEGLSQDEMGKLVEISAKEALRANTEEECLRCVSIILEEKANALHDDGHANDQEWAERMKSIQAQKKGETKK